MFLEDQTYEPLVSYDASFIAGSVEVFAVGAIRQRVRPQFVTTKGPAKVFSGPHILLNIHLQKLQGSQVVKFELVNKDTFNIGLFEFDFETFGNRGHIEFSSLDATKSITKAFQVQEIQKSIVKNLTIFDDDASERFTRVIVQFVIPQA